MHCVNMPLHTDIRAKDGQTKGSAGPLAGKIYNEHISRLMPERHMSEDDGFEEEEFDDEDEDEFGDEDEGEE